MCFSVGYTDFNSSITMSCGTPYKYINSQIECIVNVDTDMNHVPLKIQHTFTENQILNNRNLIISNNIVNVPKFQIVLNNGHIIEMNFSKIIYKS